MFDCSLSEGALGKDLSLTDNGNIQTFSFLKNIVKCYFSQFRAHCRLSKLLHRILYIIHSITCLRQLFTLIIIMILEKQVFDNTLYGSKIFKYKTPSIVNVTLSGRNR